MQGKDASTPYRGRGRAGDATGRTISDDELESVTARLRVIADPTRVRLMWLLDDQDESSVQELADRLNVSHQMTSWHLSILFQAGLVIRTRVGRSIRYTLADWTALWLVDQIAGQVQETA